MALDRFSIQSRQLPEPLIINQADLLSQGSFNQPSSEPLFVPIKKYNQWAESQYQLPQDIKQRLGRTAGGAETFLASGLGIAPAGGLRAVTKVSKALEPLAQEARKYKSAEEFVNEFSKRISNRNFGDVGDFNLKGEPRTVDAKLFQDFMDYAQKPEIQKIYEQGGNDNNVLTDIWNKANKGIKRLFKSNINR